MTSVAPAYVNENQLIRAAAEGYARSCGRDLPPSWDQALAEIAAGQSMGDTLAQWVVTEICASAHAGDGEFDVCRGVQALQTAIQDLQHVVDSLTALAAQVATPPHRRLSWRPVVSGRDEWRLYVEGVLSRGMVSRYQDRAREGYQVLQLGFDRVVVDTLEDGYDLLLQREWSARQASRLDQALSTRRALLEQQAAYAASP